MFVQYLKSGREDEDDKKQALMAELQRINDYLAQPGKVCVGRAGVRRGKGRGGRGSRGGRRGAPAMRGKVQGGLAWIAGSQIWAARCGGVRRDLGAQVWVLRCVEIGEGHQV